MSGRLPLAERPRRSTPVIVLGVLSLGLLWAYWPTLLTLSRRWSHDPQYTHAYVVPLFAAIVLYFRRASYPAVTQGSVWGAALLLAGAALRQLGAVLYIEVLDPASLIPSVAGVCLLAGGWALLRWCWPALTFLLFVLPSPYQVDTLLSLPLRGIATGCSTYALQTLGVPAIAEGNIIVVDDLQVGVAEACSGLGMLMTFFALSTAVAFIMRRPLSERLIVFFSAVPVGVLMNVARITLTVFLYRFATATLARVVFHDVAGWVMMPAALGILWLEMRYLEQLWPDREKTGPVQVPRSWTGGEPPAPVMAYDRASRPQLPAENAPAGSPAPAGSDRPHPVPF